VLGTKYCTGNTVPDPLLDDSPRKGSRLTYYCKAQGASVLAFYLRL
jgi:hypothetical protein